jgi:hypothetical protein
VVWDARHGPYGARHTVVSRFEHEGRLINNIDVFFLGRHEPPGVALHFETQAERAVMKEIRWWASDSCTIEGHGFAPKAVAAFGFGPQSLQ